MARGPARPRPEQVGEVVRQVVAEALARGDLRDPRVGLVTLTGVVVSGDLSHARIAVLAPGEEEERQRVLEGLASAAGFLRSRVARALVARTVPELHFELDRGLEQAARINAMLAEIRRQAPAPEEEA